MAHRRRIAIAIALGTIGLAALMPLPAAAGGCDPDDSAYCGDRNYGYSNYGYRDYRDYGDRDSGDRDRDDYGYRDYGYRHHYHSYDDINYYGGDRYGDYDRGYGLACDPDGDRCYRSSSGYWDYHQYYRRLGYHWN